MKEMIRKILDAIPEIEIRKYLEEKEVSTKSPTLDKATIAKAKREAEKIRIMELTRKLAK